MHLHLTALSSVVFSLDDFILKITFTCQMDFFLNDFFFNEKYVKRCVNLLEIASVCPHSDQICHSSV